MMELRDYQKEAVEDLKRSITKLLRSSKSEICVFQSPTGSGKTLMVSDLLRKLVKSNDKKFSFVWVSVRKLHEQSKEGLERYYEDDRLLKCSYFEDLEDNRIGENEVLFINWHSINKKDNIYVRENERDINLTTIAQNTKEEGREIILIIDESHHTAKSEKSLNIIMNDIAPKLTLEVSATPHLKEDAEKIKVNLDDVKSEEMIKSEVTINPSFDDLKKSDYRKSNDKIVIDKALEKREELVKLYKKEGSNINPLILIQLPDSKAQLINKKDGVVKILKDSKITEENGKLAIWLSEEKTNNLDNLEKSDNEIEVLIFKQAIALGWDCPRASILVIFRETKSFDFTIQTIGRIMRMPELKYYENDELNKGYIFTNLENIKITEDYAKDYITEYESKRENKIYDKLELTSYYLKRQREKTRLSGEFAKIFMNLAEKNNLLKKIISDPRKITRPVIVDGKIEDIDKKGDVKGKNYVDLKVNKTELQEIFDKFIYENCNPYAPADSSDRMKTAIYQFFNKKYKISKYDFRVQEIVIANENRPFFREIIHLSKNKFKETISKKLSENKEVIETPDWEVPPIETYKSNAKKESREKSIMQPFYLVKKSAPEEAFMKALDKSKKVKWWYRNGDSGKKYFAILYKDDHNMEWAFYVDYIVKFKDGKVGLFDTKSGTIDKNVGVKSESLQKYLKIQNKKGENFWGGIVIPNPHGEGFFIDETGNKDYNPGDLSKWKVLEI